MPASASTAFCTRLCRICSSATRSPSGRSPGRRCATPGARPGAPAPARAGSEFASASGSSACARRARWRTTARMRAMMSAARRAWPALARRAARAVRLRRPACVRRRGSGQDGGQRLVQLVGDARGHLAQRAQAFHACRHAACSRWRRASARGRDARRRRRRPAARWRRPRPAIAPRARKRASARARCAGRRRWLAAPSGFCSDSVSSRAGVLARQQAQAQPMDRLRLASASGTSPSCSSWRASSSRLQLDGATSQ